MQIWLTNTAIWYSAFQGAELILHDNLNGTVHYHRTRLMNEGEAKCQNLDVPVSRVIIIYRDTCKVLQELMLVLVLLKASCHFLEIHKMMVYYKER